MNTKKHGLYVVVAVVAVAFIFYILNTSGKQNTTQTPEPQVQESTTPQPTASQGLPTSTFTETINYGIKRHNESITVTVTLKNGVITELKNQHSMRDHESVEYQEAFENEIQTLAVGKKISDLNLSRVGGASFTTKAFMEAINTIKLKS